MNISKSYCALFGLTLLIQFISLRAEGIAPASANVSESSITNSESSLKAQICRCNVFNSICDDRCCCDPICSSSDVKAWKQQGQCLDQEFIYSLSTILPCSQDVPKTLSDLQSGLRIYYKILKILFCVAFDNSNDDDRYKEPTSAGKINLAVSLATSVNYTKSTDSYLKKSATNSDDFEMFTIARPGFGSPECTNQGSLVNNNLEAQECFYKMTLATFCVGSTFADLESYPNTLYIKLDSGTGVEMTRRNIYIRDTTLIGFTVDNTFADIIERTADSAGICTCENFVSEVHYQIQLDENNAIQTASYDLVITKEQTFDCSEKVAVKQKTSLFYVTELVEYPRLKGPAYRFGDPLVVGVGQSNGSATDLLVEAFLQPLNYNYINLDGTCAMVSATGTNDEIDDKHSSTIEFGYNQIISCSVKLNKAELDDFCNVESLRVLMYKNIADNFKYIAQFPNANTNYIKDWVKVDNYISTSSSSSSSQKICSINSPLVSIYYTAIGDKLNPGYKINSADVSFQNIESESLVFSLSTNTDKQTFNLKTFVRFIPQPQSSTTFVAPNPTVKFSLPDNVLTPFITKK